MLPPLMFPVDTVKLEPVMPAPVTEPLALTEAADIAPAVIILPPVTLPVTETMVPV
jgi:hypothetical protein